MGLFDTLKNAASQTIKQEANRAIRNAGNSLGNAVNKAVNNAVNGAKGNADGVGKGINKEETFIFAKLPTNVDELKAMPEWSLNTGAKAVALTMAVLMNYTKDPEATFAMLDELKGPADVSTYEKNFIKERLNEREYIVPSFFHGATVENNYTPTMPYKVTVTENPYSYDEENYGVLYVRSAGADELRPVKVRKKPSTGQWFLTDVQCLGSIRVPIEQNPWA